MCDKAVKNDTFSLVCVPDWFVAQQQIELWDDDDEYYVDDEILKWYEGYKERKTQKANCLASIKVVGLVLVRRREKRDRKIVEVKESCFLSKKE